MVLLKIVTMCMTLSDRWELAYFYHLIIKNGRMISLSIKHNSSKLEEASHSLEFQGMWVTLTSLESFTITSLGLAVAVEKVVHPSIVTSAEVLELFRHVASFYFKYDCRASKTSLVYLFKDNITRYYANLRKRIKNISGEPPPGLTPVTPIFESSLEIFKTDALQKCGHHLIQESDHVRTGSTASAKHCIDMLGNQFTCGKALKDLLQ